MRHDPQVPLSQELGDAMPLPRRPRGSSRPRRRRWAARRAEPHRERLCRRCARDASRAEVLEMHAPTSTSGRSCRARRPSARRGRSSTRARPSASPASATGRAPGRDRRDHGGCTTLPRYVGRGKLVAERGHARVARQVVELEGLVARGREVPHHRQDRRDADAAGDEHVARARLPLSSKSLRGVDTCSGRRRRRRRRCSPSRRARPLSRLTAIEYRSASSGRVAQRVAARHRVRRLDQQVGAGRERRQRRAVGCTRSNRRTSRAIIGALCTRSCMTSSGLSASDTRDASGSLDAGAGVRAGRQHP